MTHFEPLIPGLHARSEALVQASRDHDRGRIDDAALRAVEIRDRERLVGAQVLADYGALSTGQLDWQDLFRPFLEIVDGLEAPTLVRFLDTNTFYRRPDLSGELTLSREALPGFLERYAPAYERYLKVLALPSPTAFVAGAADEDGAFPDPALVQEITGKVLRPVLERLPERSYELVVLVDPWLPLHPEPEALLSGLAPLGDATDPLPELLFQVPFQDVGPLVPAIAEAPVDGFVADLTLTNLADLAALPDERAVGLGIVDARSSLIESPDHLLTTVERAVQVLGDRLVHLTPTGDLQHVPEEIARAKLGVLGETARAANAKFGGGEQ